MTATRKTTASVQLASARLASRATLGAGGFALRSPAFDNAEALDPSFTAAEEDAVAPPLTWTAPPPGTAELVLVVEEMSAPGAAPRCHWLVWGLAPAAGRLLEGEVPPKTGKNANGNSEWLLPAPRADETMTLAFQLFASDTALDLAPGASRDAVLDRLEGHVLAAAVLTGTVEEESFDDEEDDGDDGDNDWQDT